MQKSIVASVMLLLIVFFPQVYANQESGVILFEANNLKTDKGQVRAVLFDREVGFPHRREQAIQHISLPIVNGTANGQFQSVPYGDYAISYYHDEDNNNKLKTYFIGLPKEGVGASRDAKGKFGPPQWQDAFFNVNKQFTKVVCATQYLTLKSVLRSPQ